jgi:hypothetical protein
MFDLALFAAAYALFHFTHGIADYWLQTSWMANNKSKKFINLPLTVHVVIYSLSFIPALLVVGVPAASSKLLLSLFVIGVPHLLMDNRLFLTWFNRVTKGWTAPKDRELPYVHEEETVKAGREWTWGVQKWPEAWGIEQAVKVHVSIHMDQKFHYLCLGLTALWLSWK